MLLATSACRGVTEFGKEAVWPTPRKGAVVSEHPLATKVGIEILDDGGNAADAAVATALALAVVYPQAGNLGGGGFALWVPHLGEASSLDFRETAPQAARADLFLGADGKRVEERSLRGPLAVGVPGTPAGLAELLAQHGSGHFTLAELAEPAIELAREGFRVDAWLARDLAQPGVRETFNEAARAVFFPRGKALREGDTLVQPDLARTLELFAEKGAAGFYRGPVADALVSELARTAVPSAELGGPIGSGAGLVWITNADLASYKAIARKPLVGWFRGLEILTMPPPSSGGLVLLQMLGILEGLPLESERTDTLAAHKLEVEKGRPTTTDSPGLSERMVHWWIEASRGAFADRAETMGDPDFVAVPVAELLSPGWIAERRVQIGESANTGVQPWREEPREGGETTHLSVLDAHGNACSLTTTLNMTFGSGILVSGAGFLLNNEIDDFAIQRGSPNAFGLIGSAANAIAPGKRPLSSMTPTVLREGGHANVMVLGSPGGPRIVSAIAQVLLRMLVLEQPLQEAILAPRLHQQWNPIETYVEPEFDAGILAALENRRGHKITRTDQRFASVQAIRLLNLGATPIVFSDPRRGGTGAVQGGETQQPARPPKGTGSSSVELH
jgi:gamma-glutamyltranspeptidase / glutathione hydrolase